MFAAKRKGTRDLYITLHAYSIFDANVVGELAARGVSKTYTIAVGNDAAVSDVMIAPAVAGGAACEQTYTHTRAIRPRAVSANWTTACAQCQQRGGGGCGVGVGAGGGGGDAPDDDHVNTSTWPGVSTMTKSIALPFFSINASTCARATHAHHAVAHESTRGSGLGAMSVQSAAGVLRQA